MKIPWKYKAHVYRVMLTFKEKAGPIHLSSKIKVMHNILGAEVKFSSYVQEGVQWIKLDIPKFFPKPYVVYAYHDGE